MVPEGWTYSTLEGLIDIKHGFAFKSEHFTSQGQFVLLTPGHFNESGGFRDQQEKTKYYTGVIPDGYLLTKGDLLLAMTEQAAGLLGSAALIPKNNKYLHNQRLGLIKVLSPSKIDSLFLFWLYNSPEIRKQIAEQASGTKVKHTSPNRLIGITTLLPPKGEQTKIAQILSTWDKAIATTERLLANSQQQKQALMQQLLTGQKRFAGFTDVWETVRLGDVAKMNSGGTPASAVSEYYDGDIPWVSIADMTKHGKWISKTERSISQLGLDNSSARIYPKNTILYAMYASIGECSIALNELASSQAILGIQPNAQLSYLYIYYYLSSLKEKIKTQGQQGTQANLNAGMVKDFNLPLPPLPEQQKIAQVLSTADAEIANLQAQLAKLKLEKKSLMQQLLTGQRRVKLDAEAAA